MVPIVGLYNRGILPLTTLSEHCKAGLRIRRDKETSCATRVLAEEREKALPLLLREGRRVQNLQEF